MNILEKELEDFIYESIQANKMDLLKERGLECITDYDVYSKQLDLGSYGRLDIVAFKYSHSKQTIGQRKTIDVGVFELKKGEINFDTLKQAMRYCKGLEVYIGAKFPNFRPLFHINLIGTSFSGGDFIYLSDYMKNLHIYTTKIDLETGINFIRHKDYRITKANISKGDASLESILGRYVISKIRSNSNVADLFNNFLNQD